MAPTLADGLASSEQALADPPAGLVPPTQRRRSQSLIGEIIVDFGFARRDVVESAVGLAREQGRTTGELLVESRAIRPDQLARALAERFGLDYVDLTLFPIDPEAVALLDVTLAKRYGALPIGFLPD